MSLTIYLNEETYSCYLLCTWNFRRCSQPTKNRYSERVVFGLGSFNLCRANTKLTPVGSRLLSLLSLLIIWAAGGCDWIILFIQTKLLASCCRRWHISISFIPAEHTRCCARRMWFWRMVPVGIFLLAARHVAVLSCPVLSSPKRACAHDAYRHRHRHRHRSLASSRPGSRARSKG